MKKNFYTFNGRRVTVSAGAYSTNGTLAVQLESSRGGRECITVNLCSPNQSEKTAFLDTNNYPGIGQWIEENGIGRPTGITGRGGFCEYPLYIFNV